MGKNNSFIQYVLDAHQNVLPKKDSPAQLQELLALLIVETDTMSMVKLAMTEILQKMMDAIQIVNILRQVGLAKVDL